MHLQVESQVITKVGSRSNIRPNTKKLFQNVLMRTGMSSIPIVSLPMPGTSIRDVSNPSPSVIEGSSCRVDECLIGRDGLSEPL
jgi:hypothetical protein